MPILAQWKSIYLKRLNALVEMFQNPLPCSSNSLKKLPEHGMTKIKTIYIYRNENHLNESVVGRKPISGVVEVTSLPSGETAFEFQMIFRKPVKLFARRKVIFHDEAGINFHGLWWAEIEVEATESIQSTERFSDIQLSAKLSAVALPLCYIIGPEKADSNKYCVITTWVKDRMSNGSYS